LRSHTYLKQLYRQYNKRFFNNKLPNDISVGFAAPTEFKKSGLGKYTCAVTLFEKRKPVAIFINRFTGKGWAYIKSDLLHEMAHVAHPRAQHGPVWQAEMKRLAAIGAFKGIW
jgi:hypothetical protein